MRGALRRSCRPEALDRRARLPGPGAVGLGFPGRGRLQGRGDGSGGAHGRDRAARVHLDPVRGALGRRPHRSDGAAVPDLCAGSDACRSGGRLEDPTQSTHPDGHPGGERIPGSRRLAAGLHHRRSPQPGARRGTRPLADESGGAPPPVHGEASRPCPRRDARHPGGVSEGAVAGRET